MCCNTCGNNSCNGGCKKSCVKVHVPTTWHGGNTGIPGLDGSAGVGIVNIIDNGDGTMTIFLSDNTQYDIDIPGGGGINVTEINPVPGDDTQWELVYSDLSTAIIDAAYYIENSGTGVQALHNQANHPTKLRTFKPKNSNSKLVVELSGTTNEIDFNVKQYGMHDAVIFLDNSGANNYMTQVAPRYETGAGGTQIVTKSGGGSPISNSVTDYMELAVNPIDSYKAILYYNIRQSWDLTYDQTSYNGATGLGAKGRFHCRIPIILPNSTGLVPLNFFVNGDYYGMNHTVCTYDIYKNGVDQLDNKLRRYGERKVADCLMESTFQTPDQGAGWLASGSAGEKLFFRYPYIDNLSNPGGGGDVVQRFTFDVVGSIICNLNTDTDTLSGFPSIKNH